MSGIVRPDDVHRIDEVRFGTDGWRAIIGADFNTATLARTAEAAARVFLQDYFTITPRIPRIIPRVIIGYDCRENAGRYAALVGVILASYGFEAVLSNVYCPTPALCFTVSQDERAIGGIMLTSSHNPAEYLGIKLRMSDGGASPKAFTDRVEAALTDTLPESYNRALAAAEAAINGTPDKPATHLIQAPELKFKDIMTPYLDKLVSFVDTDAIAARNWKIVVDPLYGAGRHYLSSILRRLGLQDVIEVNAGDDPTFAGLHPEPILPWINEAVRTITDLAYDACLITDGDGDRIGAVDTNGAFVNPHRILTLIIGHLIENKGLAGRVVRTMSGSNLVKRQCERLGLELMTTPIGFKWIYEEMLKGDVLIGGEESGGIGIPAHVRERDGLLMALLLIELMSITGKRLDELVDDMLQELGNFVFARRDLHVSLKQKEDFLSAHALSVTTAADYQVSFTSLGETVIASNHCDGLHLSFASDAWLLMRPSGTEPLVRVYAEATEAIRVEALLDIGCAIVQGQQGVQRQQGVQEQEGVQEQQDIQEQEVKQEQQATQGQEAKQEQQDIQEQEVKQEQETTQGKENVQGEQLA